MITYTMDDLAHPQILDTAIILARKQVRLGFCRHQDQEDLVQDLMLYLSKKFRCFTGGVPLVDWACKLIRNYIKVINQRLLGISNTALKGKRAQATVSVASASPTPTPNPVIAAPVPSEQHRPTEDQEPASAASSIPQPHAATSTANGQSQMKTTVSARVESVGRAQGSPNSSGWGDPAKKPEVGVVHQLLQGFWNKLSSWVQGHPRDGSPARADSNAKNHLNSLLTETQKDVS